MSASSAEPGAPGGGALAVVRAWQDAANRRDVDAVLALSTADVEVAGPRGSGRGHDLLRAWLGRAGVTLETRRLYARGAAVVADQHGVWRDLETGEVAGEADVATAFRVDGGRVARLARHDSLDAALADAGLAAGDEVPAE